MTILGDRSCRKNPTERRNRSREDRRLGGEDRIEFDCDPHDFNIPRPESLSIWRESESGSEGLRTPRRMIDADHFQTEGARQDCASGPVAGWSGVFLLRLGLRILLLIL